MHVGVGSTNPVKRRAVERVLAGATVDPVGVDSGVPEQPWGHAETARGAETRARNALRAGDRDPGFDLGIGIEGGVAAFEGIEGTFLVMWAAATDGQRLARGAGPSLELPAGVAERVREGEELGPVMDDVLGESDVAEKQGAAGAFTAGRLTRTDALADAVRAALGPFVSDCYRGESALGGAEQRGSSGDI